jgi:hypothetical protein
MKYVSIILILTSLMIPSFSKVFTDTLLISQFRRSGGWLFMDRMTFDEGASLIQFNIKISLADNFQK